jgi:hypothetical protein
MYYNNTAMQDALIWAFEKQNGFVEHFIMKEYSDIYRKSSYCTNMENSIEFLLAVYELKKEIIKIFAPIFIWIKNIFRF